MFQTDKKTIEPSEYVYLYVFSMKNGRHVAISPHIYFSKPSCATFLDHTIVLSGLNDLHTVFAVAKVVSNKSFDKILEIDNGVVGGGLFMGTQVSGSQWGTYYTSAEKADTSIRGDGTSLLVMLRNTSVKADGDFYLNSVSDGDYTNTQGSVDEIGKSNCRSNIQEIIIYPSDQTANKSSIETDINTEYTIY